MSETQKTEMRNILKSLQEDIDGAVSDEEKAEAVQSALICLLDSLADDH